MKSNQKTQILCILFSDLKGYSDLRNDNLKNLIVQEMKSILQRNSQPEVQLIKTMGDGLLVCSPIPLPLTETALRLRDSFKTTDWKGKGFPGDFLIRIGLHVDEMIVHYGENERIEDVIGIGVDTTARIEPITEPNAVFCSRRFYEMLESRGVGKIVGIAQGRKALAKQYGEMDLYELRWTHETVVTETLIEQRPLQSIPMPNVKKSFTDKNRKDFLRQSFGVIKNYFIEAVKQLQNTVPEIEGEITTANTLKFTCEIYLGGKRKCQCKIWIDNLMRPTDEYIFYSENYRSLDDTGHNDMIIVENDNQKMYLKSSIGPMSLQNLPDTRQPSSPEKIAEYMWLRVTQNLKF